MENEAPARYGNLPRKMAANLRDGPVVQRATLGEIKNRQIIPNVNAKGPLLRKSLALSNIQKPVRQALKENVPNENALVFPQKEVVNEEHMEVDECQVNDLSAVFSSQSITDIDEEDRNNPQLVSAYVKDIYKYLWHLEDKHKIQVNYLDGHAVTSRMRGTLIDWLVQVHQKFTLIQETLYLTVSILDRFLQIDRTITKHKLQLVGVSAMYIAAKYEEIYIPDISDFSYMTEHAFSKKEIRQMEVHMLNTLKFYLSFPLPLHFLRRDSKAGHAASIHHTVAKYIMELTIVEYSFSHYKASLVAAASLYISLQIIPDSPKWDVDLSYYSNYTEEEILPVVYKLAALIIRSAGSKHQTIRNKYKSSKMLRVSERPELRPTSRLLRSYAEKASLTR